MKNKTSAWLIIVVLGWMGMMYYFSNQPGLLALPYLEKFNLIPHFANEHLNDDLELVVRKLAHVAEYAVLYVLIYLASRRMFFPTGERSLPKALLFALFFCLTFAASDEVHQLYVKGRDGRIIDVFIDLFGVMLGQMTVLIGILLKQTHHL